MRSRLKFLLFVGLMIAGIVGLSLYASFHTLNNFPLPCFYQTYFLYPSESSLEDPARQTENDPVIPATILRLGWDERYVIAEVSTYGKILYYLIDTEDAVKYVFGSKDSFNRKYASLPLSNVHLLTPYSAFKHREKEMEVKIDSPEMVNNLNDCLRDMRTIAGDLRDYRRNHNQYPESLKRIHDYPDPWGNPYRYENMGTDYNLYSEGPPSGKSIRLPNRFKKPNPQELKVVNVP